MPDFSSTAPMKTNNGMAANTKLEARSSIFSTNWCTTAGPKVTMPNAVAVSSIAKAT